MSLAATTAHASMFSLPDEVLAVIFDLFVFEAALSSSGFSVFKITRLPSQFVLMSVCRKWEDLCTSLPELWTKICFNLRPAQIVIGLPDWTEFALVCEEALHWSGSLLLTLELQDWNIIEEDRDDIAAHMHHNKARFYEEVADDKSIAYRILQLVMRHSSRWKEFSMRGYKYSNGTPQISGIPWAHLTDVAHRIPMLESLSFHDLWHIPSSNYSKHERWDIFLEAPRLSVVNFNASIVDLDIPWSQLEEITLDYSGFAWNPRFDDYLTRAMKYTTAPTVSLDNTREEIDDTVDTNDLPVTQNPHVVDLRLSPMNLQSNLHFPNLSSLSFKVGTVLREDIFGVLQAKTLLENSGCRLLDLTMYEWAQDYEGQSIEPLLPYLETLQSLTINASPVEKTYSNDVWATNFTYIIRKLRDLLVASATTPVNMPYLTTLTVNITPSPGTSPRYLYDAHLASAIWDIVRARMLVQWPDAEVERFHINIPNYPTVEATEIISQEFKESQAWQSIQSAGVNFGIYLPVV
ncbi:hypothetical protein CYLTODRAFT_458629 [Cylindrobasidium torrendii FP15055 ss-10]|uniref:Uncharacterized protein n=1 Tax=Cylindrobasidium torrendii FP15055 ss-10 TaxID=1314674 RepID=A0A0D7B028_9AGAR|nr:hypothetical protein CYLTODRAFT_458629 [Cylindrobasidium torrendii FP15055 ss-10]